MLSDMGKLISTGPAAEALGVSASTLRRWGASGRLVPVRTEGEQRRYWMFEAVKDAQC